MQEKFIAEVLQKEDLYERQLLENFAREGQQVRISKRSILEHLRILTNLMNFALFLLLLHSNLNSVRICIQFDALKTCYYYCK